MKILNSFSLNMLNLDNLSGFRITFVKIGLEMAKSFVSKAESIESYVGHQDTANIFTSCLGVNIQYNRATLRIDNSDPFLIGQYSGPRLPEGAKQLPEGAKIEWLLGVLIK